MVTPTPDTQPLIVAIDEILAAWTGSQGDIFRMNIAIPKLRAARALDAARASVAEPREGLDVERLARALIASDLIRRYDEYARVAYPVTMTRDHLETLARDWSVIVAREYAVTLVPPCDYCDESLPLVDGWHIREADPEGLEGIQRIPCARR